MENLNPFEASQKINELRENILALEQELDTLNLRRKNAKGIELRYIDSDIDDIRSDIRGYNDSITALEKLTS